MPPKKVVEVAPVLVSPPQAPKLLNNLSLIQSLLDVLQINSNNQPQPHNVDGGSATANSPLLGSGVVVPVMKDGGGSDKQPPSGSKLIQSLLAGGVLKNPSNFAPMAMVSTTPPPPPAASGPSSIPDATTAVVSPSRAASPPTPTFTTPGPATATVPVSTTATQQIKKNPSSKLLRHKQQQPPQYLSPVERVSGIVAECLGVTHAYQTDPQVQTMEVDVYVDALVLAADRGFGANKTAALLKLIHQAKESIVTSQTPEEATSLLRDFFVFNAGAAAGEEKAIALYNSVVSPFRNAFKQVAHLNAIKTSLQQQQPNAIAAAAASAPSTSAQNITGSTTALLSSPSHHLHRPSAFSTPSTFIGGGLFTSSPAGAALLAKGGGQNVIVGGKPMASFAIKNSVNVAGGGSFRDESGGGGGAENGAAPNSPATDADSYSAFTSPGQQPLDAGAARNSGKGGGGISPRDAAVAATSAPTAATAATKKPTGGGKSGGKGGAGGADAQPEGFAVAIQVGSAVFGGGSSSLVRDITKAEMDGLNPLELAVFLPYLPSGSLSRETYMKIANAFKMPSDPNPSLLLSSNKKKASSSTAASTTATTTTPATPAATSGNNNNSSTSAAAAASSSPTTMIGYASATAMNLILELDALCVSISALLSTATSSSSSQQVDLDSSSVAMATASSVAMGRTLSNYLSGGLASFPSLSGITDGGGGATTTTNNGTTTTTTASSNTTSKDAGGGGSSLFNNHHGGTTLGGGNFGPIISSLLLCINGGGPANNPYYPIVGGGGFPSAAGTGGVPSASLLGTSTAGGGGGGSSPNNNTNSMSGGGSPIASISNNAASITNNNATVAASSAAGNNVLSTNPAALASSSGFGYYVGTGNLTGSAAILLDEASLNSIFGDILPSVVFESDKQVASPPQQQPTTSTKGSSSAAAEPPLPTRSPHSSRLQSIQPSARGGEGNGGSVGGGGAPQHPLSSTSATCYRYDLHPMYFDTTVTLHTAIHSVPHLAAPPSADQPPPPPLPEAVPLQGVRSTTTTTHYEHSISPTLEQRHQDNAVSVYVTETEVCRPAAAQAVVDSVPFLTSIGRGGAKYFSLDELGVVGRHIMQSMIQSWRLFALVGQFSREELFVAVEEGAFVDPVRYVMTDEREQPLLRTTTNNGKHHIHHNNRSPYARSRNARTNNNGKEDGGNTQQTEEEGAISPSADANTPVAVESVSTVPLSNVPPSREPCAVSFTLALQTPLPSHSLKDAVPLEQFEKHYASEQALARKELLELQEQDRLDREAQDKRREEEAAKVKAELDEQERATLYLAKVESTKTVTRLYDTIESELGDRQGRILKRILALERALQLEGGDGGTPQSHATVVIDSA